MRRLVPFLYLASLGVIAPAAHAANLKVLTAGAFKQVVVAMVPAFEQRTGHKVEVPNDTAGGLAKVAIGVAVKSGATRRPPARGEPELHHLRGRPEQPRGRPRCSASLPRHPVRPASSRDSARQGDDAGEVARVKPWHASPRARYSQPSALLT